MNWKLVLDGLTRLALYLKSMYQKSEKAQYEDERKETSSGPADAFQRDFDAEQLRGKAGMQPDQTNDDIGK